MEQENKYVVGECRVEGIQYNGRNWVDIATEIAAVSRNKSESKNPERRFDSLIKEAALSTPSRAFEFLPTILKANIYKGMVILDPIRDESLMHQPKSKTLDLNVFLTKIARFSYTTIDSNQSEYLVHTNARTLLKAGYNYEDIPSIPTWEVDNYKAVRITCPYFIWAQLMTHTALSKISQSDRVSGTDEYWLPDDIINKFYSLDNKQIEDVEWLIKFGNYFQNETEEDFRLGLLGGILATIPQERVQQLFKDMGYPREIWSRAPYYFKMKTFIMGGWRNDPHAWDNLFLERGVFPDRWKKTWVQKETQEVAMMIEKIVNG